MTGRTVSLLLALFALLAPAPQAHAHKLEVKCHVRPGWKVQVEGWYEGGDPARGARVTVFRDDGHLLIEGKLDRRGVYVFPFTSAEKLRVTVTEVGHRAEATIPAEVLARHIACTCAACLAPEPSRMREIILLGMPELIDAKLAANIDSELAGDRSSAFPIVGVATGIGFLLAVAGIFTWRSAVRKRHT